MKKITKISVLILPLLFMVTGALFAQSTLISKWGTSADGSYWPVINDSSTAAGSGMIKGSSPISGGGWATIVGGLNDTMKVNKDSAIVITGQLVFTGATGAGNSYTPLRYALAYSDSATLKYQYTDSAAWSGPNKYSGYEFDPRTGDGIMANGGGGEGTVWTINSGHWNSTWSNNGKPVAAIKQQPYNAELVPGTYNFAFSIKQVNDTTNEVKWYLEEQNKEYWFGGSLQVPATTNKINAICFGINTGDWTELDVTNAKSTYGNPITVPEAPFQSFYVKNWGTTAEGNYWPVMNDTSTVIGNGTIKGSAPINGDGWATIEGGFGQSVPLKKDSALVVTGQLVFTGATGAGNSYTPLRYAIAYEDSATLKYQYTDSAAWMGPNKYSGYEFDPRSGDGTMANGGGGSGTVWTLNSGHWNSTWSNNGGPIAAIKQAPRNAEIVPGTYNFAFSIQQVNDTTNEIKWYMEEQNKAYWFGGTLMAPATTNKINAVMFALNGGDFTQLDVKNTKVDYSTISIPPQPWQSFYVSDWGFLGGKLGGTSKTDSAWTLTPGSVIGNATISGSNAATGWAVVGGSFGINVKPQQTSGKAIVVSGDMTLGGGGFEDANSLRFGLFNAANIGKLDSTQKVGYVWSGTDTTSGYLFIPSNGSSSAPTWASGNGNAGGIVNGAWYAPSGSGAYGMGTIASTGTPGAGKYHFTITVQPNASGNNMVNLRFAKTDGSYLYEGALVDSKKPGAASEFNSIIFGINNSTTDSLRLENVKVDLGDTLDTPIEHTNTTNLPVKYALQQNYPNPFNPTTNIKFSLPKTSEVQLSVYNILGQKVMTLVNGKMQAGFHQVTFDASHLASGMYIYRIKAGNFISSKKMMLIK